MATLEDITGRMKAAVGENSGLGRTLKFDLKGQGFVFIDGGTVTNNDSPADLTITIVLDDLEAVGDGKLDAMSAALLGRMKVSDLRLAKSIRNKLSALLRRVRG